MKLNLLLFFIFGVSASASGIRGISPIKGSERRMLKKTSSESESTSTSSDSTSAEGGASKKSITIEVNSDDEVVKCSGSQTRCNLFYNECTTGMTTKTLNNRVRRLKSGSTSGSSADDNDIYQLKSKSAIESCSLGAAVDDSNSSTSTSTSSDTSKKSRKLKKTSSESESTSTSSDSTSAEGGASKKSITIEVNSDDEVVKCSGSQTRCNLFYKECTTGMTTKTLNNRVRRLKSGSTSGSSADDNDIYQLKSKSAIESCSLGTAVGDSSSSTSTSTSSDTSKKSRRTR